MAIRNRSSAHIRKAWLAPEQAESAGATAYALQGPAIGGHMTSCEYGGSDRDETALERLDDRENATIRRQFTHRTFKMKIDGVVADAQDGRDVA